ncbi:RNA 3'-terminal phosphate cyclase [Massilia oculi]|uniref:RNA 3'-terminal phosphate cyclase n=1 Tax=Massilia hydrophila TaxID=3044279 RepID=A0ABS7YFE8_9BURK|nr:RNA 3'-terminal phosphate cyclase [Massilia oculi]MCA1858435.1 RNA 3'-terminal phosphate cyclase [Massilia oculi]
MIDLDGSAGEGGGQILRTALVLSMVTGQPFRITRIRANRSTPGLMRQHLAAVRAAARISGATVSHAELGSEQLSFEPGDIVAGDYEFAIGSAGSCTLVLQTLALALLHARTPSTVRITGGTHNEMAPPVQFLQRAYGPLLGAMGACVDFRLERYGFYPAGGGAVVARVEPCKGMNPIMLQERGARRAGYAEAFTAGISPGVGQRELAFIGAKMGLNEAQLMAHVLPGDQGPGNAVLITLEHEHVTEVFTGFGAKMVRAEVVAGHALKEMHDYIGSGAAVGEHLADQLLLPFALAGGGCFSASTVSRHALTNADVIARFLPVEIGFEHEDRRNICVVRRACGVP